MENDESAINVANEALKHAANSSRLHHLLGDLYTISSSCADREKALDHYMKAQLRDPMNSIVGTRLDSLFHDNNNFSDISVNEPFAIKYDEEMVEADENDPTADSFRAVVPGIDDEI
ncbi:unnamed protein product [Cyprideis torosa]|uniref:Uncharacterized protein n=1 Tax=Cyprideis torosa TaxID=163714 RepID=A0A7R8WBI0_9CRUS|nr:unnamed protein product [Cyprideis torosa]CAG0892284.1 unnamed protein product [Cyprideis torosa]